MPENYTTDFACLLDERVSAYCLALSDREGLGQLYLSSVEIGEALHSFGQPTDWRAQACAPRARQAALGQTIDGLARHLPRLLPGADSRSLCASYQPNCFIP